MNENTLLRAIGGIDDRYIAETGELLAQPLPRRSYRAVWRTALIAAALAALFSVTAYAMGWFGLRSRTIETAPALPAATASSAEGTEYWVSLNGYAESPEYKANAEWTAFWWDYVLHTDIDYDSDYLAGADAETVWTARFYGCYDRTMLDKLYQLAGQYSLKLHTDQVTPLNMEDFYRAAGTGAFLSENGDGGGYLYEDGSFKFEGEIVTGEPKLVDGELQRPGWSFVLHRNLAGTILPYHDGMDEPEDYEEWDYTTVHRDTVRMCYEAEGNHLMIFFDRDGVFVLVESGGMFTTFADKREMEELADNIVFHELLKHKADFSVARHGPTVCQNPGQAADLADFLASDEGRWAAAHAGEGRELGARVCPQSEIDSGWNEDEAYITEEEFAARGYDVRLAQQSYALYVADNGVLELENGMHWVYIPEGADYALPEAIPADYADGWFYRNENGAVLYIAADLPEGKGLPVTDPHDPVRRATLLCRTEGGWLIGRSSYYHSAYELEAGADRIDPSLFP